MKKKLIITFVVVLFGISIYLIPPLYKDIQLSLNINHCIKDANILCNKYDISVYSISVQDVTFATGLSGHKLVLSGELSDVEYLSIFNFVQEIDSMSHNYRSLSLVYDIYLNGLHYELDVLNENELNCNGNTIYTYISPEEQEEIEKAERAKIELQDMYPYEGLPEKYISYTKLGPPSEKEYSFDYDRMQERARHIEYRWYTPSGDIIAVATVKHWDFISERKVEGYIYHIWFSSKFS